MNCFPMRLRAAELVLAAGLLTAASAAAADSLVGELSVVWGDGSADSPQRSATVFVLTTATSQRVRLDFGHEMLRRGGGLLNLNGRRVEVWLADDGLALDGSREVVAIRVLGDAGNEAARDVIGSKPWISVLCKFPDIPDEPEDLSFFSEMFANSPGRLDHYWREVSYDNIDIVGSTAVDWVDLPEIQTYYVPTPGSGCGGPDGADLYALFDDCTAAADPFVDFSNGGQPFEGINLMFNSDLDGCAWGGGMPATLDGVSKTWRTTWEPPWGYRNVGVMAHEMGHGFGLPHSNNWDNDSSPYDNTWDVMSQVWAWGGNDPVYGVMGKHTNSYHKDVLGWITAGQRFEVSASGVYTITIDQLALPVTLNHRMAVIPVPGSNRYYTLETRDLYGLYDGNLPGNAVIIHEVDPYRNEPAWAYDEDVPPGDTSAGEGSMWRVGETFRDLANQIRVTVDSATADGFQVTIVNGDATTIFTDAFESGNIGAWN